MKRHNYFLLLIAVLSLITIPVFLLSIPRYPIIDRDFAFFLLYPCTVVFILFIYALLRNKFNLLLLPLCFILLFSYHCVVGFFVIGVGLYSNPHYEWHWYLIGFFLVYTVPFFIITLVISAVIEFIKYRIRAKNRRV